MGPRGVAGYAVAKTLLLFALIEWIGPARWVVSPPRTSSSATA
jgi:hypothetical protein